MSQGWIKLHRKLLDNAISPKPDYAWLWVALLLLANHKDNEFIWNNKKIIIKKGQLLTGRFELSKKTGISESKVYRILKYLEIEQQIEQQTNNKYTIITIHNWEQYQETEQENEQPVNSQRTASEQPVNTNKNEENEKELKNVNKNSIDIKNIDNSETLKKKVDGYKPKSYMESKLAEWAKFLGEDSFAYLLGKSKQGHFGILEWAIGIMKETDLSKVDNLGSYFNKIVEDKINT